MKIIILDFGSGNTCKNNRLYVKKMIDELEAINTGKHKIVIKWQLFEKAEKNIPLDYKIFDYAYNYAKLLGYETASSAFDLESLSILLQYDTPFIKLANNPNVYYLEGYIPRKIPILKSVSGPEHLRFESGVIKLACVSKYPATPQEYIDKFGDEGLGRYAQGISDHTTDFSLFERYDPNIIEWHYKLEDSTGLDAGPFAKTPQQLESIL